MRAWLWCMWQMAAWFDKSYSQGRRIELWGWEILCPQQRKVPWKHWDTALSTCRYDFSGFVCCHALQNTLVCLQSTLTWQEGNKGLALSTDCIRGVPCCLTMWWSTALNCLSIISFNLNLKHEMNRLNKFYCTSVQLSILPFNPSFTSVAYIWHVYCELAERLTWKTHSAWKFEVTIWYESNTCTGRQAYSWLCEDLLSLFVKILLKLLLEGTTAWWHHMSTWMSKTLQLFAVLLHGGLQLLTAMLWNQLVTVPMNQKYRNVWRVVL